MDKTKKIEIGLYILFVFLGIGLSYLFFFYTDTDNCTYIVPEGKEVDGLWIKNYTGHFICVDITGMPFWRALEVCQHEVGHEIFARVCEKDFERCLNITENGD